MPDLPVSQALLCQIITYSIFTADAYKLFMVIWIVILIETILIWQWNFKYFQYPSDVIVNMKVIYTPYHWFHSIEMLNRYTTSTGCAKDREIQL